MALRAHAGVLIVGKMLPKLVYLLPHLHIRRFLGEGAMGVVYEAEQEQPRPQDGPQSYQTWLSRPQIDPAFRT